MLQIIISTLLIGVGCCAVAFLLDNIEDLTLWLMRIGVAIILTVITLGLVGLSAILLSSAVEEVILIAAVAIFCAVHIYLWILNEWLY